MTETISPLIFTLPPMPARAREPTPPPSEPSKRPRRISGSAPADQGSPELHKPRLILSKHVRGTSILDQIADAVNMFCGSMWVFVFITVGVVAWLFLGNIVGFDKTPWPLLLTILNLPQLSIMISLQVSANRAQAASDRRAIADHEDPDRAARDGQAAARHPERPGPGAGRS